MDDTELAASLKIGDFAAARPAIAGYSGQMQAALKAATGPAARAAIYREFIETLSQHLSLAQVLRAHLSAQIQGNAGSCLYESSTADRHCWQFEG
jgi:hypothetical protein